MRIGSLLNRSLVNILAAQLAIGSLAGQSVPAASNARVAMRRTLAPSEQQRGKLLCPGSFPTDLTMKNCEYTEQARLQQWAVTSFTDQAILGAVVYGTGAEIIRSPSEWARTWLGVGDRIGVRYTQAAARGSAEFIMGHVLRDDPRHLGYKDDPHTHYGTKVSCRSGELEEITYPVPEHIWFKRLGHIFLDSVTVLKSSTCGDGHRWPALDRLVGVWAGAYGGYPWYPRAENTFENASQRAALAYGSTLAGSFYTEFSPEISLGLSRLFAHRAKPQ